MLLGGLFLGDVGLDDAVAFANPAPDRAVRFATFNASLNREKLAQLLADLAAPDDPQARNVAEIIQRFRSGVLLINEFDHAPEGRGPALFQENYLANGQRGAESIEYPHRFAAGVNTGVASGLDLDGDGQAVLEPGSRGYGNDALGFGPFPSQYGMVLYSEHSIDRAANSQFRTLLWKDIPGALLPTRCDGARWNSAEALEVFRLSSKIHWDVPIRIGDRVVNVLNSHPTPPAFDGLEDRNHRRDHDEIRLWADYLTGGPQAAYLGPGATEPPSTFVILGDLNADPSDGDLVPAAISQPVEHHRVDASTTLNSRGAFESARTQAGANAVQKGPPERDTADIDDRSVGNLRSDDVLPSKGSENPRERGLLARGSRSRRPSRPHETRPRQPRSAAGLYRPRLRMRIQDQFGDRLPAVGRP